MSIGVGSAPIVNLPDFDEVAPDDMRTAIEVWLPFCLPGRPSELTVETEQESWTLNFRHENLDPATVADHLEKTDLKVDDEGFVKEVIKRREGSVAGGRTKRPKKKFISLDPDRWGRSWRTIATLKADGYHGPHPARVEAEEGRRGVGDDLLDTACRLLNRVLNAIGYVTDRPKVPRLAPGDFWSVTARFYSDNSQVGHVQEIGRSLFWWRGPKPLGEDELSRIQEALRDEEGLSLWDRLLVDAQRKIENGDYRGAVIDAVSAVDAKVSPFLRTRLQSTGGEAVPSPTVTGEDGLGLKNQVLLTVCLLASDVVSEEVIHGFIAANKTRNDIVHNGKAVGRDDAETHVDKCEQLVEELQELSEVA